MLSVIDNHSDTRDEIRDLVDERDPASQSQRLRDSRSRLPRHAATHGHGHPTPGPTERGDEIRTLPPNP